MTFKWMGWERFSHIFNTPTAQTVTGDVAVNQPCGHPPSQKLHRHTDPQTHTRYAERLIAKKCGSAILGLI